MSEQIGEPTLKSERIAVLDIIRGFSLFGVLWMNLQDLAYLVPQGVAETFPTASLDAFIRYTGGWLAAGKAQALFSISFGFGFAMLMDRAEARGADSVKIYRRRLAILFALGVANWLLLWLGDILHAYALVGLLLLLARRWPNWLLLAIALPMLLLSGPLLVWWGQVGYGSLSAAPWNVLAEEGAARRWDVFQSAHYSLYLRENFSFLWNEYYTEPTGMVYVSMILARFLIGVWIYRQGWLQRGAQDYRRWLSWTFVLLPAGLLLAGIRPTLTFLEIDTPPILQPFIRGVGSVGLLILPLGYASAVVCWCRKNVSERLTGFAAAGQMALTNYVMQSFLFLFAFYGIGLGLLRHASATLCLVTAIVVFTAQLAFSRWWLARYRFGPLEWLWRSGTYWTWQPMRLHDPRPLPSHGEAPEAM